MEGNRALTEQERHLAKWMLEHGSPQAKEFLPQLDLAEATSWRCRAGARVSIFRSRIDQSRRPAFKYSLILCSGTNKISAAYSYLRTQVS